MSGHLMLDLALAVLLLSHALRGWRTGALISGLGVVGLLTGGALALWALPRAIDRWGDSLQDPMPGIVLTGGVMLVAILGESLLTSLGARLRARVGRISSQRIDSALGAVVSVLVTSVMVTLLGGAVRPILPKPWAATMNSSQLLPRMDAITPDAAGRWAGQVTQTLGAAGFPRVFSGLETEPVLPVPEPEGAAAKTAAVRAAGAGIVKIQADAPTCSEIHAGTGWVVAPRRVVTNAHVVAGSESTTVRLGGVGRGLDATVVAFDPDLDLAILDVPKLEATPLRRVPSVQARQDVVVAGFPQGGPYTVRAARVRGTVRAGGDDIYGGKGVERHVYSIAGTVVPGNSGGPLLTTDGRVAGTLFARSMVDPSTGYALTDEASDELLDAAATLRTPVATGRCAKI